MVSGRQSPQRRVDRASWNQKAHEEWARRCDVIAAPAWTHPNGGLYLYETEAFGLMFAEIISHLLPTGGKHDLGCDECLIVNYLWTFHRSSIRFLPPDFNINLHQTPAWANNPVMQSYIYHFVGPTKKYLDQCRWQRAEPPELPYPWDAKAIALIKRFGNSPPQLWQASSCLYADTIANLLAIFPQMRIQIDQVPYPSNCRTDEISNADRKQQFTATFTSYLNLPKLLLRLGPNASRVTIAS